MENRRSIRGYAGFYEVSDAGRVRSCDRQIIDRRGVRKHLRGRFMKTKYDGHYCRVILSKRGIRSTRFLHRLVLQAFVGKCPPGKEGCHKDGRATNNRLANLRWATPAENHADKRRHLTLLAGEHHQNCKLTTAQVREIRALPAGVRGVSVIAAWARDNGVSPGHVYNVRSGHRRA